MKCPACGLDHCALCHAPAIAVTTMMILGPPDSTPASASMRLCRAHVDAFAMFAEALLAQSRLDGFPEPEGNA